MGSTHFKSFKKSIFFNPNEVAPLLATNPRTFLTSDQYVSISKFLKGNIGAKQNSVLTKLGQK